MELDTTPAAKLLLLESGQTIICELASSLDESSYRLIDPRVVMIQAARPIDGGESTETTVSYTDWMPLSSSREFTLSAKYVVLVTDPLDSLVDSYLRAREATNG